MCYCIIITVIIQIFAFVAVALFGFRFGLSAALKKSERETAGRRRVNLDYKKICNTGRVEYLIDSKGIHRLSKRFQDRVMQLPQQYDIMAYGEFIRDFGTVSYGQYLAYR